MLQQKSKMAKGKITTEEIKSLREETGLSVMQCQKALEEAHGDKEKAIELLRKTGSEIAAKKSSRELGAGVVSSYIHSGDKVGVMLELLCETDFVSKNPEFKSVAKDIGMHIAAMKPNDAKELLAQPFIKDPGLTVAELISNTVQKFGERTEVGRFVRFSLD